MSLREANGTEWNERRSNFDITKNEIATLHFATLRFTRNDDVYYLIK